MARAPAKALDPGVVTKKEALRLGKELEKLEAAPDSLFAGYWELVESNGIAVAEQAGHFEDSLAIPDGVEVKGPPSNLRIEGTAEVESKVTFDARPGPVIVDKGAAIESFSRIMGPAYVGPNTKIHSALIGGGTSIFEGCRVGGQLESSVMMSHSNKSHHGYVGHSYVGEWVNLGAGSTFSDLKNTYGNVRVELRSGKVDSGLLKLGPAIGDLAKVSIGALVYAGRSVGTGSHVSGLVSRNVPSFTYFDGFSGRMLELRIDSVLETQRRMMERRDRTLSRAEEELIRRAWIETSLERKRSGAVKGSMSESPARPGRRA